MLKKDFLKTLTFKLKTIALNGNSLQFCFLIALIGVFFVFISNLFSFKNNPNKNLETKSDEEICTYTRKYKEDLENSVKKAVFCTRRMPEGLDVMCVFLINCTCIQKFIRRWQSE